MTLTIYHYPSCSTCRKAIKWLEENGHPLNKIHIVDSPPTKEQLQAIQLGAGTELKKLFNTSGQRYRELNIKEKLPNLSEDEQLDLLASHGKLIKRPLVTDGHQATIGFKEAQYEQVWGKG
ncbi:arsenate reductase family protein [Marinicrinis sediminis]|uniref:Arsenate reductase family protein n=1 Tax=Marinicrinis sediminis TaxID=1652465 RepID=A0ABW5R8C0_9BACL